MFGITQLYYLQIIGRFNSIKLPEWINRKKLSLVKITYGRFVTVGHLLGRVKG
jgi:hypothetical protein